MKGINEWEKEPNATRATLIDKVSVYYKSELGSLRDESAYRQVEREHRARVQTAQAIMFEKGDIPVQKAYREALGLMARIYDGLASHTGLWIAHKGWEGDSVILGLIAEHIESQDKTIVDAGCGIGLDINFLAGLFPDRSFIGYDCSPKQIELAAQRTKRLGHKNVRLFVADHRNIARFLPPSSTDIVYVKSGSWEDHLVPGLANKRTNQEILASRYQGIRNVLKGQGTFITSGRLIDATRRGEIMDIPGFYNTGEIGIEISSQVYIIDSYNKIPS